MGEKIVFTFFGGLLLIAFVLLFVYAPMAVVTVARCLERGYPNGTITWNLRSYCLGYDGAIHPVVVPAKK